MSYYYTRDHLGSIREMTNSSGTVVARYDYDAYGRVTVVTSTTPSDFQYAGMYVHAPSGLNLTLFRAYDSITGRWLSRDPIAERGGINLYDYVGNNPISRIDPLGLDYNNVNDADYKKDDLTKDGRNNPLSQILNWILTTPDGRAATGAAQFTSGVKNMFAGVLMCDTGAGAIAGAPLAVYGIHGAISGVANMQQAGGPSGKPFYNPPTPPPPSGGTNDPNNWPY